MKEPSPKPDWRGHTCVVVASGPSLSDEQIAVVEASDAKTIAVNSSYQKLRAPDVVYACDFLWIKIYQQAVRKRFSGNKTTAMWTQDRSAAERWQLNYVRHESRDGLGKAGVRTGGNSGYGAINLAYLFGCRRILLIGYDMQEGPKGEKHWHGDHVAPLTQKQQFVEWRHKMRILAKELEAEGAEVVNCTIRSALECFPMGDLKTELAKC